VNSKSFTTVLKKWGLLHALRPFQSYQTIPDRLLPQSGLHPAFYPKPQQAVSGV
jgi:hypothetical protein